MNSTSCLALPNGMLLPGDYTALKPGTNLALIYGIYYHHDHATADLLATRH